MIKKYTKKNGSTAYMVKVYLGIDPVTGKKKTTTKRGFKTQKAAKQEVTRLQLLAQEDEIASESNRLFSDIALEWFEQYKNTVKESTYVVQRVALQKHVLPLFGKLKISKISIPFCQKQVNHWYSYYKKYSNLIGMTNSIFQYAKSLRLIRKNPMDGVIRPKRQNRIDEEKYVAPFYTKDEILHFLQIAKKYPDPLYPMFHILAFTGLRKGELLALRWKDINFKRGTLSVKQTLTTVEGWKLAFQTPKTEKSLRTISIDKQTLSLLRQWILKQKAFFLKTGKQSKKNGQQLLFATEENKPYYLDFLNHNLNIILKEHDLKYITVHGFRHTHCSLLFESGASLKEVQVRLGHTDIRTTMDIYTHVSEQKKEETANRFAEYMNKLHEEEDGTVKRMVKTQKKQTIPVR
ncbi:site-specific integrase [Enterococcus gallinarum]|uniref:site-specific integrase n=1 Tax=Enterococcus gallinarum TaxID=1353 RepID=UPI002DBFD74C|nr:site-specific integrase [Enterococcus gallinarum]MEB5970133.1 site-specific integrase [Enterococcus gallinarum]